ncbi:glycosyltransferase family 2 protein [Patescibacteria group bacterium]|nr:glycosyltransferase family 2 protein [Patescibacteria group bacterium]
MNSLLSVILITKNNQDTIVEVMSALKGFGEVIVVDGNSADKTVETIKKIIPKAKVFQKDFGQNIGLQRKYGLKYATGDWVLLLDSDEVVSGELAKEIKSVINNKKSNNSAFEIPYQNYFLGRPVNYGGEDYKMVRLFKKDCLEIRPSILHNQLVVKKGQVGKLTGKIVHRSYRSLGQVYSKFSDYSVRMRLV